ncbi:MAG: ribosome biogenesis GTPase Der [Clostridia bacterium]|nr:ribosome biogenesis GTPase Der [Clostridia bacterium]MBP5271178.1 ribosome biogenesis GTPase Der [Clostridia bacterium]
MAKTVVAIVGRPNVGKSTLFNKLIGERRAIVEDVPGVTRDRIYGETEWRGRTFVVVDTGGISADPADVILSGIREQAQIAIDTADVILFMTDVRTGLTSDDLDVAAILRRSGKPVIPVVNKCDSVGNLPGEFYEFYELGCDHDPIPLSAVHGTGTGDILDAVYELAPGDEADDSDSGAIKVAVIGKPNAGKSSIINRIVGEERLIVSDIPGTTRDAIDTPVENEFGRYVFVDTAGIRRSSRIHDSIEHFSVLRSRAAVERADVCLIMIDASEGITEQDAKIAGISHEAGKAAVIVVNKWDKIGDKDNGTVKKFDAEVRRVLSFMPYAPIMYVSALTGKRVSKLFEQINLVYGQSVLRISTGMLNDMLADATERVQPPSDKGKRLKIYYMTEVSVAPPTFVIFCNSEELFHFSYRRYIENCLREAFGFNGTPINLIIRERGDKND